MSSYLSSILTTTTSRYNSLRRTLLSDEADGDTEDDSHISRVLRAYYTEKGRPFPPWLPPDPKAPQAAPAQFVSAAGRPGQMPPGGRGVGRGGLSDLWDSPQSGQAQKDSLSLRRGQQGRAVPTAAPAAQARFGGGIVDSYAAPEQRPLPSQRAGSHQSAASQQRDAGYGPAVAKQGSSAQERLKARLKASSPSQSPMPSPSLAASGGGRNPYDRSQSDQGAYGREERRQGSGGGGGREQRPFVSATAPWSSGEGDAVGGGAYGGGGGSYGGGGGVGGGGGGRYGRGGRSDAASGGGYEESGGVGPGRRGAPPAGGNRYGLPSGPKRR
ncbi:MAG: hypothetical protein M1832_001610 [Thelocarpon impressellum]|nr:MAG: hypothetical protein M1832_001610 [Thelocarpon impressellum]